MNIKHHWSCSVVVSVSVSQIKIISLTNRLHEMYWFTVSFLTLLNRNILFFHLVQLLCRPLIPSKWNIIFRDFMPHSEHNAHQQRLWLCCSSVWKVSVRALSYLKIFFMLWVIAGIYCSSPEYKLCSCHPLCSLQTFQSFIWILQWVSIFYSMQRIQRFKIKSYQHK